MAILSIDYTEPHQSTYEKIVFRLDDDKVVNFDTGNFVVDYYHYQRFLVELYERDSLPTFILNSSSVDHFFMDGSMYRERYFNPETSEFVTDLDMMSSHPSVATLSQHKNFTMVKNYVYRCEKKMGFDWDTWVAGILGPKNNSDKLVGNLEETT